MKGTRKLHHVRMPDETDLTRWLARKISRHENWETFYFGMEWERHDAEEEWAWCLYYLPTAAKRVPMAYGNTHVKSALDNFFVSELHFRRPAWQALDNTCRCGNVHGWKIVDELLQLSAWNVEKHGLNWLSVLAGMIDKVDGDNCMPSFYFRPFGSWWSLAKHKALPTYNGIVNGCEYLRPIPLSDNEKDGEPYVDSEMVFEYVDADQILTWRDKNGKNDESAEE